MLLVLTWAIFRKVAVQVRLMARYSRHVMQVERVQVALVIFGYLAFYFLSSGFVIIAVVSSPPLIFIYLFIIELDADTYPAK